MDDTRFCAIRLSKAGYGSVEQILNTSSDIVLNMLDYEGFLVIYENAFIEMNRREK